MNAIEEWRRRQGMTQRQIAEILEVSDATVVSAEKGRAIRRAAIDAFIEAAGGALRKSHFVEAAVDKQRVTNGKKQETKWNKKRRRYGIIKRK